jgi:hypothetical protein
MQSYPHLIRAGGSGVPLALICVVWMNTVDQPKYSYFVSASLDNLGIFL